jgi:hypothetical protein|tara:strand:- start:98 stop:223 length:126 start_codon:yes stop_codon:yes gene_type:complete
MEGFITDKDTSVIGDGIITYYNNGIYINHEIIKSNEHQGKA